MIPVSKTKYFMSLDADVTSSEHDAHAASDVIKKSINVRLFGSFSLTVDGNAVHISSEKGRELLALLVEKRGSCLTTREAIVTLWECESDDKSRARYRKIASCLMVELKRCGIDYIVERNRGVKRIVPECIECDYYDYLDGHKDPSGAFLPEYSWSEFVRID